MLPLFEAASKTGLNTFKIMTKNSAKGDCDPVNPQAEGRH